MKVFKNLSTYILALGFSATLFSGCEDYLNVSDDLAAEMTMEEVFNNTSYARRFHRYIYTGIPDVSNIIITSAYADLTSPQPDHQKHSDNLHNRKRESH